MQITRRKALTGLGISASGFGLASIVDRNSATAMNVDYSGTTATEKPIVKNEQLSIDGGLEHGIYYKSLVTSKNEVRWEYLRKEDSSLAGSLEKTNWGSELLTVFGLALPRNVGFDPKETTLEDGTLTKNLTLQETPSSSSELTIRTHVMRLENVNQTPETFEVDVTY
ncbi:hypothetical protein [Halorussus aquaticus]|uniref:Tat (Twin-arginine translocation) pathway signal sequence n=1 Tax=Halorussus aquaticus TaxID=2953748 RepID=A0ABD5Q277_9EURY|nr:hypothetical protein [Halorussus aquaticus]